MSNEKKEDYHWVMEKIKARIVKHEIEEPTTLITDRELALMTAIDYWFLNSIHILCRWHVNMNVLAKTKKHFPSPVQDPVTKIYSRHPKFKSFMKSWNQILRSTSLKDYNANLAKFEAENPSLAVKYCVDTWLILWKEKLVSLWVNQTLHFGVTVTSPIEGCHATLKSYLKRSTSDLKGVFERLLLFWVAQQDSIQSTQAMQQNKPRHRTNPSFFLCVKSWVHDYALNIVVDELSKLPTNPLTDSWVAPWCNCTIRASHGLPCYHELLEKLRNGQTLSMDDIHVHWWFNRPKDRYNPLLQDDFEDIQDPQKKQQKGRPKGALGRATTKAKRGEKAGDSSEFCISYSKNSTNFVRHSTPILGI
jgi:hypothetical protein